MCSSNLKGFPEPSCV